MTTEKSKKSNICQTTNIIITKTLFVLSGTTVIYSVTTSTVAGGSYNNTTGILTVTDKTPGYVPNGLNPVGQVNVPGKSINGILRGYSDMPFMVTYSEPWKIITSTTGSTKFGKCLDNCVLPVLHWILAPFKHKCWLPKAFLCLQIP